MTAMRGSVQYRHRRDVACRVSTIAGGALQLYVIPCVSGYDRVRSLPMHGWRSQEAPLAFKKGGSMS
jgi:hypothetical protein